jgi:hypothetical protein
MNWLTKATKQLFLILLFGAIVISPRASAQTTSSATPPPNAPQAKEASDDDGFHFLLTPYIWFAGVNGSAGVLGHDTAVHASFGDIFSYLNIGLMGVAEPRYNRIVMPVDFLWMKLSDNKGLPVNELSAESIKVKFNETMIAPKIGYRFFDEEKFKADVLIGARYWHVGSTLTLNPSPPLPSYSDSANWVDEVAGMRFQYFLTPKAMVTIAGDAGAGGSKLDYQVGGFLGYQVPHNIVLLAGFRYLSVDYRPSGSKQFVYDVNMPGLVIGATFNLK